MQGTKTNIYFKDARVLLTLKSIPHGGKSEFVERAILFYIENHSLYDALNSKVDDVLSIVKKFDKKI